MKNLKSTSKILHLLLICVLLAPAVSRAQALPILTNVKMIDFDKVGTDNGGKIDPPPPPVLSQYKSEITKVSFYPNPCKDMLMLTFNDDAKFQKVQIYNLVGNLIYETTLVSDNAIVNTSRLKAGVYILKTESGSYRFTKI